MPAWHCPCNPWGRQGDRSAPQGTGWGGDVGFPVQHPWLVAGFVAPLLDELHFASVPLRFQDPSPSLALQSIESEPVYTEHRCLSMPPPRPCPRPAHHGMACDAHAGLTRGTARPGTPSGWHRAWQSALPGAPGSGSSSGPCGGCKSFGRSRPNPENKPGGAAGGRSEGDVCRRVAPPQRGLETRFIPRWTQLSLGPGSWSSVMLGTSLRISSSLEPSSSSMDPYPR